MRDEFCGPQAFDKEKEVGLRGKLLERGLVPLESLVTLSVALSALEATRKEASDQRSA